MVDIAGKISYLKTKREDAVKNRTVLKAKQKTYKKEIELRNKALLIYDYVIEKKYDDVVKLFESTITAGLKDIFNEDHEFKFIIGRRGTATTVEFGLNNGKYGDFIDISVTQGMSLKEVVSIILRLVILSVDKNMPKFLWLDEQLGGVESDRRHIVVEFLKRVSKVFDIKLVVITHIDEYKTMCDNVIKLKPMV